MMLPPAVAFLDHRRRHAAIKSVKYTPSGQRLDIWRGENTLPNAPMMVWVPGGAWASGSRMTFQGHALMSRMVDLGWVCLSIDYRTAPRHRWPSQYEDVTAAVNWARTYGDLVGGDPNFVAIAGASAGGHLATLAGLEPDLVEAAVSLYGSYDWEDRSSLWRTLFMGYIERVVVGRSAKEAPGIFRAASPMSLVNAGAAPTMMVHGTKDVLIYVDEARRFYHELSAVSDSRVDYLEIPGAMHGFDLINPGHTVKATRAIADFLSEVYVDHQLGVFRAMHRHPAGKAI